MHTAHAGVGLVLPLTFLLSAPVLSVRSLRRVPPVDYYIPGDDVHHRHPSPSPHRERSSSVRRSTSRTRDEAAPRQPTFEEAIQEESPEEAQNGDDEADHDAPQTTEDDAAVGQDGEEEPGQLQSEDAEAAEEEEQEDTAGSTRKRSSRRKAAPKSGGRRESTRAQLRRQAEEVVSRAKAFLSPAARADNAGDDAERAEAEGGEEETEANAANEADQQGENSQPEGTPARPRRRSSRRAARLQFDEKGEASIVGPAEGKQSAAAIPPSSVPVMLALATLALLLLLASPFILPPLLEGRGLGSFSPSSSLSSARGQPGDGLSLRDYTADRGALLKQLKKESEALVKKTTEGLQQQLEGSIKNSAHRSLDKSHAELVDVQAALETRMKEMAQSLTEKMSQTVTERLTAASGKEKKEREAEAEKLRLQLQSELRTDIDNAIAVSSGQLMDALKVEVQNVASKADKADQGASSLAERVSQQVKDVEERVLSRLLEAVEKRFATAQEVARMDAEIRRYIQDSIKALPLPATDDLVQRAELQAVEERVMEAMEQRVSGVQSALGKKGLSKEDRALIVDDVLSAVRKELAALHKQHSQQLDSSVQGAVDKALKHAALGKVEDSVAGLTRDLLLLRQQVEKSASSSADTAELRRYIDQQVAELLQRVDSGGDSEKTALAKLSALESLVSSLERQISSLPSSPSSPSSSSSPTSSPSADSLRSLVQEVLSSHAAALYPSLSPSVQADISAALELYSADRTNLVDYALQSSGGRIVAASPTHYALPLHPTTSPWMSLFTHPWLPSKRPEELLQPTTSVGSCWPMEGARGSVLIRLRERVEVTGLTLQHVSEGVVSDGGGAMPRRWRVRGVRDEELDEAVREVEEGRVEGKAGKALGEFEYRREGTQVQQWRLQGKEGQQREAYQYVRFDVLSNYGNHNYTCLYRIRVHGNPRSA